jgi:hypothetical protein
VINALNFFHQIVNSNRRSNSIESLSVNGSISSDQQVIRDHVFHFYESLFAEPLPWRPRMDNLAFDILDAAEASSLELPFEEMEVLEVVKCMNTRHQVLMGSLLRFSKTARM